MSIKELGIHGVNLKGNVVYVDSKTTADKIRKAVREFLTTKPNAHFKELAEIANAVMVA